MSALRQVSSKGLPQSPQARNDVMPREYPRTRRIGEQIQRELARLIREELQDPRLGLVTISGVQVSRDLSRARVFVTVLDEYHPVAETIAILNRAAGFLRHALGEQMATRTVPRLEFSYDETVERGVRLSSMIDAAVAADAARHPGAGEDPAPDGDPDDLP